MVVLLMAPIALAAWVYGTLHDIPMWKARLGKELYPEGYAPKALIGYAIFVAIIAAGFALGGFDHTA